MALPQDLRCHQKQVNAFKQQIADPKTKPATLARLLEALMDDLEHGGLSIKNNLSLPIFIMEKPLPETVKVDLIGRILKRDFPHDLKIADRSSLAYQEAMTLFHRSVGGGHFLIAQQLLDYGDNLHQTTDRGNNALAVAAYFSQISMFPWLIEKGLTSLNYHHVLGCALSSPQPESTVKAVLEMDTDHLNISPKDNLAPSEYHKSVNAVARAIGTMAPLHLMKDIILKLQQLDLFDIHDTMHDMHDNQSLLQVLSSRKHPEALQIAIHFLELGVNPLTKAADGYDSIDYAKREGRLDLAGTIEGWLLAKTEQKELTNITKLVPTRNEDKHKDLVTASKKMQRTKSL